MEGYTDGKQMLFCERNRSEPIAEPVTPPIGGLSQAQLQWCRSKWPWFEHNRVQRLADHERAAAERRV
jgi:hypothetical protein